MSCFGAVATTDTYSSSGMTGGGRRPWRWWRAKCSGIASSVGSRIRRSIRRLDGRRRGATASSAQRGWCLHRQHHRSFPPVYVDELYTHHQQPAKALDLNAVVHEEPVPSTSGSKVVAAAATLASGKATARVAAATTTTTASVGARVAAATTTATTGGGGARASSKQARVAAAAGVGAMRSLLMRSPGRGGVLGGVKGMGEVDLRAELFIRKFKEDMRLQSQRSAEEFQAMLARGL